MVIEMEQRSLELESGLGDSLHFKISLEIKSQEKLDLVSAMHESRISDLGVLLPC